MGAIEGKVFKAGKSGSLRLPEEFDFAPGTLVTIERVGEKVMIKPVEDREQVRRNIKAMCEEIAAIWAEAGGPPIPEVREPIEFPERPGL